MLIETVFAWPGIGRLVFEALLQRDYNLLLGVFVVSSVMVLAFNLITDLVYRVVDPRIELDAHEHRSGKRLLRNRGAAIGLVVLARGDRRWRCSGRCSTRPRRGTWCSGPSCRRWRWTDSCSAPTRWGAMSPPGIVHGARVSLLVGLVSTVVALAVGVPLGAVAGYFGGWADDLLMRFTEFFQTIPSFVLAIVLVAIFSRRSSRSWRRSPSSAGRRWRGWCAASSCRCARANSCRRRIVTGQSNAWIIWREILPNALSPIIVLASLMVATGDPARIRAVVPGARRPQPDVAGAS